MIHSCSLSLNVVPLWRTANAEQIETTNSFHCLRFKNAATENVDCAIVLCATQTRQFIQAPIFFLACGLQQSASAAAGKMHNLELWSSEEIVANER